MRAITRLMPNIPAVVALGRESAVGMHVVTGEAIEAQADQVRGHRPSRRSDATPAPPALHLTEALRVRRHGHAGRVDNNGGEMARLQLPATPVAPPRIAHEPPRAWAASATTTLLPRTQHGLAAARLRSLGVRVVERRLRVREMEPPPRSTRGCYERLRLRVKRTGARREQQRRGEAAPERRIFRYSERPPPQPHRPTTGAIRAVSGEFLGRRRGRSGHRR